MLRDSSDCSGVSYSADSAPAASDDVSVPSVFAFAERSPCSVLKYKYDVQPTRVPPRKVFDENFTASSVPL